MSPLSILPGRLRLEHLCIKGQRILCRALEMQLCSVAGVLEASANFRTGRILVQFNENIVDRISLSERIEALLRDPESWSSEGAAETNAPLPPASPHSGRLPGNLLLDMVMHAVLPKPLDLLVPTLSALRRAGQGRVIAMPQ